MDTFCSYLCCQVMEAAIELVCQQYKPGFACVQLVNHTSNAVIEYCQRSVYKQRTPIPCPILFVSIIDIWKMRRDEK